MKHQAHPKLPETTLQLSNAKTVGQALAMSPRNVLYLYQRGEIPGYRIGPRCVRFHLPSVLKALEIEVAGH